MMEKLIKKLNNRKGFTLIELIVVIAIIGILAAVLIPQFTGFQDKARSTQALVDAKQIATAIDSLLAEGTTPAAANIESLSGVDVDKSGTTFTIIDAASGTFTYKIGKFTAARSTTTGGVVKLLDN